MLVLCSTQTALALELWNTRLDMIKHTGPLGKMVNHVILTERGYFRATTRRLL